MARFVRQSKEEIRQKRIRKTLVILLSAAVILTGAVLFFRQRVQEQFAVDENQEVEAAEVTIGSIKTTISGSGNLTSEGVLDVEIPAKITVEDTLVEAGDTVEEGQLLAAVNVSSALSALKELQEELDALDDEINSASGDAAGSYIYAGVAGRVKAIFVQEDDDVAAAVAEHGALILLSLDGYMAVDIPAGDLSAGDMVEVADSAGNVYEGTVSKVEDGTAVILVTDNGPSYEDTVTAAGESGTLYIHEPLKVTGYAGTVAGVQVKENAKVTQYTTLLTLKDTAYSAGYEQLLAQRAEMEELYQSIVKMYQDGGIRAERAGSIQSISELSESTDTDNATVLDTVTLMTLDPNELVSVTIRVDETDIQSLDVGQEASVTIESIGEDVFTGEVSEIDKTAASSGGVTMYTATITLEKTAQMLSGMTADVAVTIEGVEDALLVPEDAVHKTSATSYVYTTYDEETGELGGMVEVVTGLSNGTYTEIVSGLKGGDIVYYTRKESGFDFGGFSFGGDVAIVSGMPDGGRMPGGNGGMSGGGGGMPGGRR